MGKVIKFEGKPKVEPLVYGCSECGGQMFYVEANPTNIEGQDTYPCLHGLFYSAETDE